LKHRRFDVRHAQFPADIETVRELFVEYSKQLGFDLCFQGFEDELAGLPGKYASPDGDIILAYQRERPVGCVAMRPIDKSTCEMKRLYVRRKQRGLGLGRTLSVEIIKSALSAGYSTMRLDTISTMKEAIGLYRSLGFVEIQPYRFNPCEGAQYMELKLRDNPALE
jgi:ribosomal protein S18 acetylase RimI-like enzyme